MMNNKIYNENKLSIYVVSAAFFLSLIIGIIAGNPGGIVLMRAFLSAILFGIIFQGGIYLIRKYVPEIKTLKEQAAELSEVEGEGEVESGSTIDYSTPSDDEKIEHAPVSEDEKIVSEGEEVEVQEGEEGIIEKIDVVESDEAVTLDELPSLDNLFEDETEEAAGESELPEPEFKEGPRADGDYISVRDARFPNEPKAIAKAIKKVMKQDG